MRLPSVVPHAEMTREQREDHHAEALDVLDVWQADLAAIEALARLQLQAGRHGVRLYLRGASPRLRELLVITGLEAVLPCEPPDEPPPGLGVEAGRQAEERKEPLGVEEEGDPGNPIA